MKIRWSALAAMAGCMAAIVGARGQALQPDIATTAPPGTVWTTPAPDAAVVPGRIAVLLHVPDIMQVMSCIRVTHWLA